MTTGANEPAYPCKNMYGLTKRERIAAGLLRGMTNDSWGPEADEAMITVAIRRTDLLLRRLKETEGGE